MKLDALDKLQAKVHNDFMGQIKEFLPEHFTDDQLEYIKCRLHLQNNFMESSIDSIIKEVRNIRNEETNKDK